MRKGLGVVLVAVCLLGLGAAAAERPASVFVIHCEPTTADSAMWLTLVDLIESATAHNVPATILFTAQWARMVLDDEARIDQLNAWIANGHEIGCHHHGYWGTKNRGAQWDGYTNTPVEDLDPADRSSYLGTMDDYMAILGALPGERRTGCLGTDEGDAIDWPCDLDYATAGHAVEHATSTPSTVLYGACSFTEIGHGLLISPPRGSMVAAYEACSVDAVFGTVIHVYNVAELPMACEAWFDHLVSVDPNGERRFTVSGLLDS